MKTVKDICEMIRLTYSSHMCEYGLNLTACHMWNIAENMIIGGEY